MVWPNLILITDGAKWLFSVCGVQIISGFSGTVVPDGWSSIVSEMLRYGMHS